MITFFIKAAQALGWTCPYYGYATHAQPPTPEHILTLVCSGGLMFFCLLLLAIRLAFGQRGRAEYIDPQPGRQPLQQVSQSVWIPTPGDQAPKIYTKASPNDPLHSRGELLTRMCRRERAERFLQDKGW